MINAKKTGSPQQIADSLRNIASKLEQLPASLNVTIEVITNVITPQSAESNKHLTFDTHAKNPQAFCLPCNECPCKLIGEPEHLSPDEEAYTSGIHQNPATGWSHYEAGRSPAFDTNENQDE